MRYKHEFKLVGFGKYEILKTEIKEPRPEGFYWVKYYGQWMIAEWHECKWIFLGDIGMYTDDSFDKIHEAKIEKPMYE
jgi:hypothetical protein